MALSSLLLRRLRIGESCSVFCKNEGGKRERHRVRETYSLKKRKGICLAKGEGIERRRRREMTNYDGRVPGRCLRV